MSGASSAHRPRSGCLVYGLFGVFLLVGSGCLVTAAVKLVRTVAFVASSSVTTGTVIDHEAHRGSKSTTYAPVVTFTAPGGHDVRFVSAISSGSSDYAAGQTVPVLFDPSDPSHAEIDEFIPLWFPFIIMAVLGTCFVALPAGQIILIRRAEARARVREEALARGLPEWQADPQWSGGQVRATVAQEMYFFAWFALVWNAIALPTGFMALREFFLKENRPALVGLLFPVVGAFLAWQAARRFLQRRRFGDLVLRLDPFPPVAGGEAAGWLPLPVPLDPAQPLRVVLLCRDRSDSSRNAGNARVLHTLEGEAVAEAGAAGATVRFRIPVPADLEPSVPGNEWVIRITAALAGTDLDATFVIPLAPAGTPAVDAPRRVASPPLHQPEPVGTGAMTCPKCGYVQPPAAECGACGLIIARYRPRPALAPPRAGGASPLVVSAVALAVLALVAGGGYAAWKSLSGGKTGEFDASSGVYRNPRYGLSLSVPPAWKRYSVQEAIQCSTLREQYADQYLLLASPSTPTECLLVVNLSGLSLDYFRSAGWDGIVDDYRSRQQVRFTEIVQIGGFQVHRMGYEVAGFYREDAMFEAGEKLMEIYFYVPDGPDAASRAEEIRGFIDGSLRRL